MENLLKFLELNCAGDVINSTWPIENVGKEISQAMLVLKQIRKSIKKTAKFQKVSSDAVLKSLTIVELCSGNALISAIVAHVLSVKQVIAVHKRPNHFKEGYSTIKNFKAIVKDFSGKGFVEEAKELFFPDEGDMVLFVSSHPTEKAKQNLIAIKSNNPGQKVGVELLWFK